MVSHIDDDHIGGLLELTEAIENGGTTPVDIGTLWFNSVEGLTDQPIAVAGAGVVASRTIRSVFPDFNDPWAEAVLASVPQGQRLHGFARRHGIIDSLNRPFTRLLMRKPDRRSADIHGLELEIVGPSAREVERLRTVWKKFRKEGIAAATKDDSPYNLSSIVVLAKHRDRTMLLTGDARGDRSMPGLGAAGLLRVGKLHVDVLKNQHHGSPRSSSPEYFRKVTANTYVVSGDHERHDNPHRDAMTWLRDARGSDDHRVLCTDDLPHMREIFGRRLVMPAAAETSVAVAL